MRLIRFRESLIASRRGWLRYAYGCLVHTGNESGKASTGSPPRTQVS